MIYETALIKSIQKAWKCMLYDDLKLFTQQTCFIKINILRDL